MRSRISTNGECRAYVASAKWLLCHPSPAVMNPMSGLLRLSSVVAQLRQPQIWVTELTDRAVCQTTTVRKAPPQKAFGVHGGNDGRAARHYCRRVWSGGVPMPAAGRLVIQFLGI